MITATPLQLENQEIKEPIEGTGFPVKIRISRF